MSVGSWVATRLRRLANKLAGPAESQLLTIKETAELLNCRTAHVYRLLDQGDITGENLALKTEGATPTGKARQRYLRVHRESAIAFRKRRQIKL